MIIEKHVAPEFYPAVIHRDHIVLPDFGRHIPGQDVEIVHGIVHRELRSRKLNDQYFPFASSELSLRLQHPDATVILLSTEGWENPGALEAPMIEEE